ncbi:MAG: DUF3365 domain-containing protein [Nitrospira sp.]|nr:DUF3365 domain-containing protein [Nitrospira sp.]
MSELTEEGKTLRVVMPIYYAKDCLACHGEPKGAGYFRLPRGRPRGRDLAGAITVTRAAEQPLIARDWAWLP